LGAVYLRVEGEVVFVDGLGEGQRGQFEGGVSGGQGGARIGGIGTL
jgi:hypothetical protein